MIEKLNPMYWIRKLNDKFVAFEQEGYQGLFELANDLKDKDNKMYCQYCGHLLNVLKMPILASNVKIGETYVIKCSTCRKMNTITKGSEKYEE